MPTFRARLILVRVTCIAAALAALAGCASSRLSSEAPPGVRLAGDWKLDYARSDDLGKAVEQLRQQGRHARRDVHREQPGGGTADNEGPARGRRRADDDRSERQQGEAAGQGGELSAGPAPRLSPVDELMSNVPRGDYLRITVTPGSFTVTSGDSSDQYTPGLASEISAEQGDAQQISGWKGGEYVIDTRPQWGPQIIQSFGLSKDGRLTLTVRLTGGGTHFTFTRVYDRTTRVAPLAPPTLN